jgi:hypothetical protein
VKVHRRVLCLIGIASSLLSFGTSASATVGAITPFVSYEAEAGTCGGGATVVSLTSAPTTQYSSPELEASGHAYVRLAGKGQYVEWTNHIGQPVTFINVRYSIPDAPGGGGITAALDLYIDGSFRQTLNLNSRQTWLYENSSNYGGNDQNPANGNPRVFFDDAHAFITGPAVAPGSVLRLQVDAVNTAAFYYIDVIDLENPPAPLSQPANSLSITSYGAVANNTNADSTSAIQSCINAAQTQGRSVWIPPDTFYLKTKAGLTGTGVTIEGAGMWYSTIYRDVPLPNDSPLGAVFTLTSCTVRNFAVDANATSRAVVDGCGGSMDLTGNFWLADSIWTQHTMSGFWASGIGGTVRNCRLISIWADGCNLNNVAVNGYVGNSLTASNNFVRGTGDDAMAINSVNYNLNNGIYTYYVPMTNVTFVNNTTIGAWGGKGLAIYGGSGHLVQDNYTSDTARYIGLGVGKFGVNGSDLLSATVVGNVIVRSGGNGYQQQQQAMMIGNDGDGQGVGAVANAYCASNVIADSLYAAVGLSSSRNIVFQHNSIINPAREGIVVGLYALRPGLGNAVLYSNTVTGLNAGMAAFTNNSNTYAVVTPTAAAGFSSMSGVAVEPCAEGGQDLGQIHSGDWATYPNVTLTGADTFVARMASGSLNSTIEIHLDNPTGTLIGTCAVPMTGDWQAYANAYTSVSNVSGIHTVCLVFKGGAGKLLNLQYFGLFASPPALSHHLAVGGIYALKSVPAAKYVRTDSNGGGVLLAASASVGAAEQFEVLDAGGGNIAFLSVISNTLVCAESNGDAPLVANRTAIGSWETFAEYDAGAGNVALRAANNSKYVSLVSGASTLIPLSSSIGATQSFSVKLVGGSAPLTPNGLRGSPGDSVAYLVWTASAGATGYQITRSTSSGGPYVVVASNVTSLAWMDAGLTNGTTYYYAVAAFNPVGQSTNSAPVDIVPGSLDRLGWVATASSSASGNPPANAIDGDLSTRWSTGQQQTSGQWFQLDMAGVNTVSGIVLAATGSPGDYPRAYHVYLSLDGVNWGSPVATGTGSSAVTTIQFAPQTARFIRVIQTGSVSGLWWSIHEVNVFGGAGTPPAAPTGVAAVAGDGQALLSWNSSPTAVSYNVKSALGTNGVYSLLATNLAALQFAATGLTNGTAYYFAISALNSAGESANSIRTRVQPTATSSPRLEVASASGHLQLSWPQDHSGWTLIVQTNNPGMGLGTNWFALPGSEVTNQMMIPVAPSEGSLFFRLKFVPQ